MDESDNNPPGRADADAQAQHTDDLIKAYARRGARQLLADCQGMLDCLARFDTLLLVSPELAIRQAREPGDQWLVNFNHVTEMLCLAATARKIDLEPYKELVNAVYAFWTGVIGTREVEADVRRLFSSSGRALYNLKRALMVEVASATTNQAPPTTGEAPDKPSRRNQPKQPKQRKRSKRRRTAAQRPLTDRQRQAMELYASNGGNVADVARAMGISQSTASQHLSAANRKLPGMLQRANPVARQALPKDKRGQSTVQDQ